MKGGTGAGRNICIIPPMQGIPWSTIALGSLLLISAYSKEDRT